MRAYAFKFKLHFRSALGPGGSELQYYCTPPVTVPDIISGLAVWWHNKKQITTSASFLPDPIVNSTRATARLDGDCVQSLDWLWILVPSPHIWWADIVGELTLLSYETFDCPCDSLLTNGSSCAVTSVHAWQKDGVQAKAVHGRSRVPPKELSLGINSPGD